MDIRARISTIASSNLDIPSSVQEFNSLADELAHKKLFDQAQSLLDHLLEQSRGPLVSRPCLNHLTSLVGDITEGYHSEVKSFCQYGIEKLKLRQGFDDANETLKRALVECYVAEAAYFDAAALLSTIDVESTETPVLQKALHYVRIAELFLDESVDDVHKAELYINKAQALMNRVDDLVCTLRFRVSMAKVLDSKRNFLQAAQQYYRITTDKSASQIEDSEIQILLGKALTCAVLGKAGLQRQRLLGSLHKDVRTHSLEFFNLMQNMYKRRLLKSDQVKSFNEQLMPHQRVMVDNMGTTVLERAVLEHNILACSDIYNNIRFEQLGSLLGITPHQAEQISAAMITEGRLEGSIDQVDGIIFFGKWGADEGAGNLASWDNKIGRICASMNDIIEDITKCGETS